MYPFKKKILIGLIAIVVLGVALSVYLKSKKPSMLFPVKDVRITANILEADEIGLLSVREDLKYVQICYGYYSGGRWHDFPAEQYELRSIFDKDFDTGFDAAGQNHLVKIGPYLIIALSNNGSDENGNPKFCEIKDSIGSEVQQYFSEYYSNSRCDDVKQKYGCIVMHSKPTIWGQDRLAILTSWFGQRFFVILEYDKIPKDYELQFTVDTGQNMNVYTLTYNQIVERINK